MKTIHAVWLGVLLGVACSSERAGDDGMTTLTGAFVAPPTIARLQMSGTTSAALAHVDAEGGFTLQVKKGDQYWVLTSSADGGMGPYVQFCRNFGLAPNTLPVPADAPDSWDFGPIVSCRNALWPSNPWPSPDCDAAKLPAACENVDAGASPDNRPPRLEPISGQAQYQYDTNGNYMGGVIVLSTWASDPDGDAVSIAWSVDAATGSARLASDTGTSNVLTVDSIASGIVTAVASDGKGGSAREYYDFARPR